MIIITHLDVYNDCTEYIVPYDKVLPEGKTQAAAAAAV